MLTVKPTRCTKILTSKQFIHKNAALKVQMDMKKDNIKPNKIDSIVWDEVPLFYHDKEEIFSLVKRFIDEKYYSVAAIDLEERGILSVKDNEVLSSLKNRIQNSIVEPMTHMDVKMMNSRKDLHEIIKNVINISYGQSKDKNNDDDDVTIVSLHVVLRGIFDELSQMYMEFFHYPRISALIYCWRCHLMTFKKIEDYADFMYSGCRDRINNKSEHFITKQTYDIMKKYSKEFNQMLEKSYEQEYYRYKPITQVINAQFYSIRIMTDRLNLTSFGEEQEEQHLFEADILTRRRKPIVKRGIDSMMNEVLINSTSISTKTTTTTTTTPPQQEKKTKTPIDVSSDFKKFIWLNAKSVSDKEGCLSIERMCQLLLRVAIGIHGDNFSFIEKTYHSMVEGYYIHATPTLLNAGRCTFDSGILKRNNVNGDDDKKTCINDIVKDNGIVAGSRDHEQRAQMCSCALVGHYGGNMESSLEKLKENILLTQMDVGQGGSLDKIPFQKRNTLGEEGGGIGPMAYMNILNEEIGITTKFKQRRSAIKVFMSLWNASLHQFLQMKTVTSASKKNNNNNNNNNDDDDKKKTTTEKTIEDDIEATAVKCFNLFQAVWVSNYFMKQYINDGYVHFFDPNYAKKLVHLYGYEFEKKYLKYVEKGLSIQSIKARELYENIMKVCSGTGGPAWMFKDQCNYLCNQNGPLSAKILLSQKSTSSCGDKEKTTLKLDPKIFRKQSRKKQTLPFYEKNNMGERQYTNRNIYKLKDENGNVIETLTVEFQPTTMVAGEQKQQQQQQQQQPQCLNMGGCLFFQHTNWKTKHERHFNVPINEILATNRKLSDDVQTLLQRFDLKLRVRNIVVASGNLCVEIVQQASGKITALCVLASLNLKKYFDLKYEHGVNFDLIYEKVGELIFNLNRVCDRTYLMSKNMKRGMKQRAIGIGAHGFQDLLWKLQLPYTMELNTPRGKVVVANPTSKMILQKIYRTMYRSYLHHSCKLVEDGIYPPYKNFHESYLARGYLTQDLQTLYPAELDDETSKRNYENFCNTRFYNNYYEWDWSGKITPEADPEADALRKRIMKNGCCNSLAITMMPGASTANEMGVLQNINAIPWPIHQRKMHFSVVTTIMASELFEILERKGKYTPEIIYSIIENRSVSHLDFLTKEEKNVFQGAYEIPGSVMCEFIKEIKDDCDQSKSISYHTSEKNSNILNVKIGLFILINYLNNTKTGKYYSRVLAAIDRRDTSMIKCSESLNNSLNISNTDNSKIEEEDSSSSSSLDVLASGSGSDNNIDNNSSENSGEESIEVINDVSSHKKMQDAQRRKEMAEKMEKDENMVSKFKIQCTMCG